LLLITVVNFAGVGLTFPPDYADIAAGEVWKEKAYIAPRQTGLLAFGDDLHFSGAAFCRLGDRERLYFDAANPVIGRSSFGLRFTDASLLDGLGLMSGCRRNREASETAAKQGSLASTWERPGMALEAFCGVGRDFLGASGDATVCGELFEALVTEVRSGDDAQATVAIYPLSREAYHSALGECVNSGHESNPARVQKTSSSQ